MTISAPSRGVIIYPFVFAVRWMSFRVLGVTPQGFDPSQAPWLALLKDDFVTNVKETRTSTYATLATCLVSPGNRAPIPTARTVVVRGFSCRGDPIICTDIRTAKTAELAANPAATLSWWMPKTNDQYRLQGRLHLLAPNTGVRTGTQKTKQNAANSRGTDSDAKQELPAYQELAVSNMSSTEEATSQLPAPLQATDWEQERASMFNKLPPALRHGLASAVAPGNPLGPPIPPTEHDCSSGAKEPAAQEATVGSGADRAETQLCNADAPEHLGQSVPATGPPEGSWDDALAFERFALLTLAVEEVDRVSLGQWPHRRWRYWQTDVREGSAGWVSQEVQP